MAILKGASEHKEPSQRPSKVIQMATMNGSMAEYHQNPAGSDVNPSICLTCESKMHLDPDCPLNNKERNRKRNGEVAKCSTCFSEWHTNYNCPRKSLNGSPAQCQKCNSIFHAFQNCPHSDEQQVEEDCTEVDSLESLKCVLCSELAQYAVRTPCCCRLACRVCAIANILKSQGRCGMGNCKASSVQVSSLVPHEEVRMKVEEIEVWKQVEKKEPLAVNKYLASENNKNKLEGSNLYKHSATKFCCVTKGKKRALDHISEVNDMELKRMKPNKSSHQLNHSGLSINQGVSTQVLLKSLDPISKDQNINVEVAKNTDPETYALDEPAGGSCNSNSSIVEQSFNPFAKSSDEGATCSTISCASSFEKVPEIMRPFTIFDGVKPQFVFGGSPQRSFHQNLFSSEHTSTCLGAANNFFPNSLSNADEAGLLKTSVSSERIMFAKPVNVSSNNSICNSNVDALNAEVGFNFESPDVLGLNANSPSNTDEAGLLKTSDSSERIVFAKPVNVSGNSSILNNNLDALNVEAGFNFESQDVLGLNANSPSNEEEGLLKTGVCSEFKFNFEIPDALGLNANFRKTNKSKGKERQKSWRKKKKVKKNKRGKTKQKENIIYEIGLKLASARISSVQPVDASDNNSIQRINYCSSFDFQTETLQGSSIERESSSKYESPIKDNESEMCERDLSEGTLHCLSQPNESTFNTVPLSSPTDISLLPLCRDSIIDAAPLISERNYSPKHLEQPLEEEKMDDREFIPDNCVCLEDQDEMCLACSSFKIVLVEDTKLLADPRQVEEKISLLARVVSSDDSTPGCSYIKLFPAVASEGRIPFPGSFFAVPGNETFKMIAGLRKVIMGSFTHVTLVRPKVFNAKYFEAKAGQVVALGQWVPVCLDEELDQRDDLKIDFGVKKVYLKSTKETSFFLPGKPKYSTVVIPGLKASSHLLVNLKIDWRCNALVSKSSKYTIQDNNEILIPLKNVGNFALEIETNSLIATATSHFATDNFKNSLDSFKRAAQEKMDIPLEEASKTDDKNTTPRTNGKQIYEETEEAAIPEEGRIQRTDEASKWRVIFIDCEKIFDGDHAQFTQIGCYAYRVKNRRKATFFSSMFPTKNQEYLEMRQKSDLLQTLHLTWGKQAGFQFVQPDGEKVKASSESEGLEDFISFLGATEEWEDNVLFLYSAECILPLLFSKISPDLVQKYVAGVCELSTYLNESLGFGNHLTDLSHLDDIYQKLHFEKGNRNLDHESFVSKYFKPTSYFIEKFVNLGTNGNKSSTGEEISVEIENSFRPGFPATVEMRKIDLVDLTEASDDETPQDLINNIKEDTESQKSSEELIAKEAADKRKAILDQKLDHVIKDHIRMISSYRVLTVGTYEFEAAPGKRKTILVEFEGIPPGIQAISFKRSRKGVTDNGLRFPTFEKKKNVQDFQVSTLLEGKYGFLEVCLTRKKINEINNTQNLRGKRKKSQNVGGKFELLSETHILNCRPYSGQPPSYEADLGKFIQSNKENLKAIVNCVDDNMSALIKKEGDPSSENLPPDLTLPVPVPAKKRVHIIAQIPDPTSIENPGEQFSPPQIPQNFRCNFCSNLLANAVLLPCCWARSCDTCAREMLTITDFKCRLCAKGNVRLKDLIRSYMLREEVLQFQERQLVNSK